MRDAARLRAGATATGRTICSARSSSKRWTETAIPVIVLLIVAFALRAGDPELPLAGSLADTARQAGEIGFVVLGMALVMIVGGIDLSVGSMFALTDFCALYLHARAEVAGRRRSLSSRSLFGALLGAVNGFLIGYSGCAPSSPR